MGLNQVLIKIVNGGLQPVFQVGLRSACAILPILLYALLTKKDLSLTNGSFWPGVFAGLFFAGEFFLLFTALDHTTVGRASIFFYTMPFWTAIMAHFLIRDERLDAVKIIGLSIAFCGVVCAFVFRTGQEGEHALLGDMLCIAAAILWAGIVIIARTTAFSKSSPEMQLLYQLVVSALVILPIAPLFGGLVREFTPLIGVLFAFQVLVVVCIGFLTWFWVLSVYPASKMASFSFLSPILGVLFGWIILEESINFSIAVALVMVSLGVYLVNQSRPG